MERGPLEDMAALVDAQGAPCTTWSGTLRWPRGTWGVGAAETGGCCKARRGAAEGLSWGDLPGLRGGGGKSSKQLILSEVHGYE